MPSLRAADAPPRAKSLIVVWMIGGASHLETYDPKPKAPSEYRGPFQQIPTNVPGIELCELLPHHARIADRFAILRSLVHTGFCHQQGAQQLWTGHPVRELRNVPDNPDLFSITHRVRYDIERTLPNYVGLHPVPYLGGAYLGPAFEPFAVYGDPNQPSFQVPNINLEESVRDRISSRRDLRRAIDHFRRDLDRRKNMEALDQFEEQAAKMLTSPDTKEAFDLSQEPETVRDRYGRNTWGQQLLMARRLVEAGVELVTTTLDGPLCGRVQNWDDHAVNHHIFDAMKSRCQYMDQAVATLIEDLHERGLDQDVMVVVSGEFGRTPKINYQPDSSSGVTQPGRDHWPNATSLLVSGGGVSGGQVIGATDRRGEEAIDRRVSVLDFLATMYRYLGVDASSLSFTNFAGRPIPVLPEGTPIKELASRRSTQ